MKKIGDKIAGGLSDKKTLKDIAEKFNVSLKDIEKQLKIGIKVELEHTKDKELAAEIAKDHLVEMPDYYDRLIKMEKEAKKQWGK